jgi:hypothetical protein
MILISTHRRALTNTGVTKKPIDPLALQDQLMMACKHGDEKTVKILLWQGANPNLPNGIGEQLLGAAIWGMCPGVVSALLAHIELCTNTGPKPI